MEKFLMRALKELQRVSSALNNNTISQSEFVEAKNNVDKIIALNNDFNHLLAIIEDNDLKDSQWVAYRLVDLHVKLSVLESRLEQFHELVDKLIEAYGRELKIIQD